MSLALTEEDRLRLHRSSLPKWCQTDLPKRKIEQAFWPQDQRECSTAGQGFGGGVSAVSGGIIIRSAVISQRPFSFVNTQL